MRQHILKKTKGVIEHGILGPIFCKILTTTSGTLSSTTGANGGKGIASVVKVGGKTGRYRVTFDDNYGALFDVSVSMSGLADNATTAGKATGWKYRNKTMTGSAPFIDIQFTNALADAELEDASDALFAFIFKDSTLP